MSECSAGGLLPRDEAGKESDQCKVVTERSAKVPVTGLPESVHDLNISYQPSQYI